MNRPRAARKPGARNLILIKELVTIAVHAGLVSGRTSMKSILLHIDHDEALEARLEVALDLARAVGGHITCLQAVNDMVIAAGDLYGAAIAATLPVIKEHAEKLRNKIEQDLANEDVPWDWRLAYGIASHRLLEASPLADIILLGPSDAGDRVGPSALVGDLVFKARAPVLVVPGACKRLDVSAPAMVAWNGSAEAAHALRAAVPLLAMAGKVWLVTIAEPGEKARFDLPPIEGAQYLSRHGIECEMVEVPRDKAGIADTLRSAAEVRGCGLMVMGAYGHSRLAEMLLGGVTRKMLADPQLPILLAH
jgi:nucleotide-binding universal stress UspA family protein